MRNGGGIKEKGPNLNTVLGWVGLSETLLGRHSPSFSISASSIHLIACLLPPPPAVIDPVILVQSTSSHPAEENKRKTNLVEEVLVMPNNKKTK